MSYKIIELKVGQHRNNPRSWIEGKQLENIGFTVGATFTASFATNYIRLQLDPKGDRKVSGRARKGEALPIVDINCAEIRASIGDSLTVTVFLDTRGMIDLHATKEGSK